MVLTIVVHDLQKQIECTDRQHTICRSKFPSATAHRSWHGRGVRAARRPCKAVCSLSMHPWKPQRTTHNYGGHKYEARRAWEDLWRAHGLRAAWTPRPCHERCAFAEGNLLMHIVQDDLSTRFASCRLCTTIVKTKSYEQIVTSGSADPTCCS